MDRYICIHGHFYQPPRENPWLEAVETQGSAYPFHDWNARISAECYAANAASRILNADGQIEAIVNNYSNISFNFGPTLLMWLQGQDPATYAAILAADKASQERFSGHGSAMAQVYNHIIMPLADTRDKYTQIRWGIRDFTVRFGRAPEGMWLAETAVDLPTLEALVDCGITYTVLSPFQAGSVRAMGDEEWQDVSGGRIDPTRAYRQTLPSGRAIDLFFYDGPISKAIAFEDLLDSGERFAERLAGAFNDDRAWPQIVHIATDGETYGHHHKKGDMALAYALKYIEDQGIAKVTNYGEYLENCPPTQEVQIIERTAWSCVHGVERWNSDCGCNSGGYPQWNQEWRFPLRVALDWLRDALAPMYATEAGKFFADPWAVRDHYIEVILDRNAEWVSACLAEWAGRELTADEEVTALELLEMQRHALLMYTSCGWFFDELSGLETVQVIDYAGRAVQLAKRWLGDAVEAQFAEKLAAAQCNIKDFHDGQWIYDHWVTPTAISLQKVTAHYAMSDLFENYPAETDIYCYHVERGDHQIFSAGKARLVLGRARVTSHITHEADDFTFTALHFENHNLTGGVRAYLPDEEYAALVQDLSDAFDRSDMAETVRQLDANFPDGLYTLNQLFRDEQLKILEIILADERQEAEALNGGIYDRNVALLRVLSAQGLPPPDVLRFAAQTALAARLRRAIAAEPPNADEVRQLLREVALAGVAIDTAALAYQMGQRLNAIADAFRATPTNADQLRTFITATEVAEALPGAVDQWHAQNVFYDFLQHDAQDVLVQAEQGSEAALDWWEQFTHLGDLLGVHVAAKEVAVTADA